MFNIRYCTFLNMDPAIVIEIVNELRKDGILTTIPK
jgi:hypothetical protein